MCRRKNGENSTAGTNFISSPTRSAFHGGWTISLFVLLSMRTTYPTNVIKTGRYPSGAVLILTSQVAILLPVSKSCSRWIVTVGNGVQGRFVTGANEVGLGRGVKGQAVRRLLPLAQMEVLDRQTALLTLATTGKCQKRVAQGELTVAAVGAIISGVHAAGATRSDGDVVC